MKANNQRTLFFDRPVTLRSQFIEDKAYPIKFGVGHSARFSYISGGNFTIGFKDDIKIGFEQDRGWQRLETYKDGYIKYRYGFTALHPNEPKRVNPIPSFTFPGPGYYEFDYEVDPISAQILTGERVKADVLKGKFWVLLIE